jgi:hypothetical protein
VITQREDAIMRIHIKTSEKNIRLLFPSFLAMNALTARIGANCIQKQADIFQELGEKELNALFREIRRQRKKHPNWCLLEITDAESTHVKIKL